jgi:hypothetical protein
MLMLLRANLLPDSNGVAATIVFTMTPEQFQRGGNVKRSKQRVVVRLR